MISREQLYIRPTEFIPHGNTLPVGITTDAVQSAGSLSVVLKQVCVCVCMCVCVCKCVLQRGESLSVSNMELYNARLVAGGLEAVEV